MPPKVNHVSRSMSTTPVSADTSIDDGIRRPRKTRLSTPASSGAASTSPVGSPGFDAGGARCRARLVAGQGPQDRRDQRERDRVQHERQHDVARRQEQAGDGRADDPGEVVERRPGRVGGSELALVADEARDQGADRRVEERREAGGEDGDRADRPQRARRSPTIQARTSMHAGAGKVRGQQHEPPVEAVGDDPGRDRQQDVRQQARGPDDAEDDRVLRLLVDEDDQGDEVQPVPDRRHELADEQSGQRPVAQQLAVCARDPHRPLVQSTPVSSGEATLPVARAWTRHRHAPPRGARPSPRTRSPAKATPSTATATPIGGVCPLRSL